MIQEFCKTDDYAKNIRKYLINDIYTILYHTEGNTMTLDELFGALRDRMDADTWYDPAMNSLHDAIRLIEKCQWFGYLRSKEVYSEWAPDYVNVTVTSGTWLSDMIERWKREAIAAVRTCVCDLLMNEFFDVANDHLLAFNAVRICLDKQDIPPSARWAEYEHTFLYQA